MFYQSFVLLTKYSQFVFTRAVRGFVALLLFTCCCHGIRNQTQNHERFTGHDEPLLTVTVTKQDDRFMDGSSHIYYIGRYEFLPTARKHTNQYTIVTSVFTLLIPPLVLSLSPDSYANLLLHFPLPFFIYHCFILLYAYAFLTRVARYCGAHRFLPNGCDCSFNRKQYLSLFSFLFCLQTHVPIIMKYVYIHLRTLSIKVKFIL